MNGIEKIRQRAARIIHKIPKSIPDNKVMHSVNWDETQHIYKRRVQKLKKEDVLIAFTIELKNRYQVLEDDTPSVLDEDEIERDYQELEKAFTEVADEVLGRPKKKRKPWISEQSWALVDQKEELNKKILSTRSERVKKRLRMEYKEKNRVVKQSMRCDKR